MRFLRDYIKELILSILIFLIFFFLPLNIYAKIAGFTLIPLIFLIRYLIDYMEESELEDNFVFFLTDLGQYLRIGQPLPVAIKSVSSNDYGRKLNRLIKFSMGLLEYGYTFEEVLMEMSKRIRSKNIKNIIGILIDSMKSGGNIPELLNRLSEISVELNYIRKERISRIRFLAIAYYGLFFLFLFIAYIVMYFAVNLVSISYSPQIINSFKNVLFISLIINAIFTGLVIGKISTGRTLSGVVHSIILLVLSIFFFVIIF